MLTSETILNPHICSECGNALLLDNMPSMDGRQSNMRKCIKCGYITDVEAREIEDKLHNQYHDKGKDPTGAQFILDKWVGGMNR